MYELFEAMKGFPCFYELKRSKVRSEIACSSAVVRVRLVRGTTRVEYKVVIDHFTKSALDMVSTLT